MKSLPIALFTILFAALPYSASAAKTAPSTATPTGNDISYPQCGKPYPTGSAFGVIGVNAGKATTFNSCFSSELAWAQTTSGTTAQPKAQLYVNTANPGDVISQITTWPTTGLTPYGTCDGTNSQSCSWQYGYNRATDDISFVGSAVWNWWLDVETANSWTSDPAKNTAALEGMVAAFQGAGGTVGIYATTATWTTLMGATPASSPLYSLGEWRVGASSLTNAKNNCSVKPFTGGGYSVLSQYTSGKFDYDVSCI